MYSTAPGTSREVPDEMIISGFRIPAGSVCMVQYSTAIGSLTISSNSPLSFGLARLQAIRLCRDHQWFRPIRVPLAATGVWFRCEDNKKQLFVRKQQWR